MSSRHLIIKTWLPVFILLLGSHTIAAGSGLSLYTPYTRISVPPGESIDYSIDVINNDSVTHRAAISVTGLPRSWSYTLRSGGWSIDEIAVLPREKKVLELKVDVPFEINKGSYTFYIRAKNNAVLPVTVNISKKGTFKTEFTTDQVSMQGSSKSNFTFRTQLKNLTGEKQLYGLSSYAGQGWTVTFKPNYQQATSVEAEPNQSKDISIEITPPYNIKAGKYKIPVMASTSATSVQLELEVEITGSYNINLTTPNGLLSSSITAGKEQRIELLVQNSGSTDLKSVKLTASSPQGWNVTFSPDTIGMIAAGGATRVTATVKAYDKAIPGDYVINFAAQTTEATSTAVFRFLVKTPMLWGWLGVVIIIATIGGVIFLFRKYGRR